MSFTRVVEDFDCGHCGRHNRGNGYTNHCRHCLWSRHVDISPGDRAEECGGLMEPVEVQLEHGGYVLVHECTSCGGRRRCKVNRRDSMDAVHEVIRRRADNFHQRGMP